MAGRPAIYSDKDAEEIASFSRQNGRLEAMKHFNMTDGQLGGLLYRYFKKTNAPKLAIHPMSGKPITVRGDVMVCGDVHAPCTDWALSQRMCDIAIRYLPEPRTLIVAGDVFNMDWMSLYQSAVSPITWEQEVAAAKALFEEWRTVFDRIVVFAGNHDRRSALRTNGNLKMKMIMESVTHDPRVVTSEWGYCLLKSGKREFRVTHGRNYSVNTGTVGNELSQKFETNIISHHQHHASISLSRNKKHIVVDNAALVDQHKLAYVILDDSKMPNMAKGFCLVRNGEPQLFVEGLSVWENHLPELAQRKHAKRLAA